jgi:Maltose acetyltransferase
MALGVVCNFTPLANSGVHELKYRIKYSLNLKRYYVDSILLYRGKLMKSEKEKMLGGELYSLLDPQLFIERQRVRLLFKAFNDTSDDQRAERLLLLQEIIPMAGKDLWIEPPFYCDYGSNIVIGDNVFSTLTVSFWILPQ